MRKRATNIAIASVALVATAVIIKKLLEKPLETVKSVDLNRYVGRWYEIASFPQHFQKGCKYTTATYSLNDDGSIQVKNSCIKDGEPSTAIGKATVADHTTRAKLNVQFKWPFKGKYWILELADDYSYAMVGHPNRKYLWILSRKPWLSKKTYTYLLISAMSKGFDIGNLKITAQKSND